jgi:dipeptidyl-peptidase-4
MKKIKYALLFVAALFLSTVAQQQNFTMEDVVFNSYSILAPENLSQLQWLPKEYSYSYVDEDENSQWLVKGFASSGRRAQLVSLETLANKLEEYVTPPKQFPRIKWINDFIFRFQIDNKIFIYDVDDKDLELIATLPEGAVNVTFSNNNKIAFIKDNNLFLVKDDEENIQITTDGKYGITNGMSVSRNEFGINGGIFWSPKGNFIAFYHEDLSAVTDYPLLNIETKPATIKKIKYPMAGETSPVVSIYIYDIANNSKIKVKTDGPKDQYLTNVTWGPDEKYLFVGHLNRDQNHLKLIKYNTSNGEKIKILFEEKDDKYVEPLYPLYFTHESNKFIWMSQRDGWTHLYLYNTDGKMLKRLTKGDWLVTQYLGFDKKGENVFFVGTKSSPIERHLYKVNIKDPRNIKQLTINKGVHRISHHPSNHYFIDQFSSIIVPREISIMNEKGEVYSVLNKAPNPIEGYAVGETKLFTIKANDDSTDLFCRMILPPNFDSQKEYPVIVYVYGGPHAQLVTNRWGYGATYYWFYYMAQRGYIIFTLDNRGSYNRGLEFEQATFRQLGSVEIEDQLTGVKYLTSLPYVDSERIGVYGWSFGGFMATSLMTRTDGAFKVGVAGGAVIDWKYYEVMYTERYMDTPQQNPVGYKTASLLNHIKNLKGKLLEVHGTADPVVVWQNTLKLTKKAADLNIPLDYYPYPGHPHHIGGKDALHLFNKITTYFLDNL